MSGGIKVAVVGALGKMGLQTVKAVLQDSDLELAAAVDIKGRGESIAELTGIKKCTVRIISDIESVLLGRGADVIVDFTTPEAVYKNVSQALNNGVACVVGTTGLNDNELKEFDEIAQAKGIGVAVMPNFAVGAVLMMKFAQEAARYFPDVEIIELHHDQKLDAPSGTSIKTAELIKQNRIPQIPKKTNEYEKFAGCRGGDVEQVRIHSVRLPGLVAHQEVIFGGIGQTLAIRHDSYDRIGFMQGVLMVIKKMTTLTGLVYGMENLL